MKNIYKTVGEKVRRERLKKGLTIEELADMSDIHYTFLGYIELGKKKASLETIRKLANALQIPVADLFKFFDKKSPKDSKVKSLQKKLHQLQLLTSNTSPEVKKLIIDVARKIAKKCKKSKH
ncbi:MAG: helix-turn-helix transcriptional regulator [Candidatus Firestonebacteria bacterium]